MLPALILGSIRSVKIGPDNYLYFSDIFSWAGGYGSFWSFYKDMANGDLLSYFYFYFVRLFTSDYHWFCFATVFTSLLLIYIAVYKMRKIAPMWMALTIYYFMFYCPMLCFVRQSIALSFCVLAMCYAYEKKWGIFICLTVIAALFHLSAIFFVILMPLYVYLSNPRKQNQRTVFLLCMTIIVVCLFFFYLSDIIGLFSLNSSEDGRASILTKRYMGTDENQSSWLHGILMVILYSPLIIISSFSFSKMRRNGLFPFWVFCLIGVFLELLGMQDAHIHRLSYYFIISSVFLLAVCAKNNNLVLMCTLSYVLLYFVKQIIFNGMAFSIPMNPYETDVLFLRNL